MLTLYQTYLSPFPTRVRLVLLVKGIEHELVAPPGIHDGADKGDYLKINPLGRVPALRLEDGRVLPESEVICEYLEDRYPEPSMRPDDPWDRARVRLLSRISDVYLVMAMAPLFDLVAEPPRAWDQTLIARQLRAVDRALDHLETFIGESGYAWGDRLSHADGTLGPMLQLTDEWLPIFRGPDLLAGHPRVRAYWQAIQRDPHAGRVIDETRQAVLRSMGR
ncbi:MAG: glutathione S-transferase family protein [Pseudomonadales bacterium]